MRRLYIFLLAFGFAFTALLMSGGAAFAVDNGQIGIQPADEPDYFHADLVPGAQTQKTAIISNYTNTPVTLLTYPVDGVTTPQGGFGFGAQTDPRQSVGAWVKLDRKQVVVPAMGQIRLPFTLSVPAKATPGDYYGGLIIQAAPVAGKTVTVQGGTAVQLSIVQRQAVRIYLTVAGTRHNQLKTEPLTWKQNGSHVDFAFAIRNTGNTILHPSATLGIVSTIGANQTLRFNVPESVLPGNSLTLHATLDGPPPIQVGKATVTERSEAGLQTSSTSFMYLPWGALVGALAAVALLVVLCWRLAPFVRRARRAFALAKSSGPKHVAASRAR